MTFLESLRQARSEPPAVWLQFIASYRQGSFDIYVFFEGREDFSFYMPEIRRRWKKGEIIPFKCKGKAGVLGMMSKIDPNLDQPWRALYFTDKDLDDILNISSIKNDRLFETEVYSIENYLVSETMLIILWTDIFQLPKGDSRLPRVVNQFQEAVKDFVEAMRLVMATIIYWRQHSGSRPLLSNVDLSNIVQFDSDFRVSRLPDWFVYFKSACAVSVDPNWSVVDTIASDLMQRPYKSYLRGKFELWFFISFVTRIANVVSEKIGDQARAVIRTHLNFSNAVDILAGRDSPPPDVHRFFDRCLPSA